MDLGEGVDPAGLPLLQHHRHTVVDGQQALVGKESFTLPHLPGQVVTLASLPVFVEEAPGLRDMVVAKGQSSLIEINLNSKEQDASSIMDLNLNTPAPLACEDEVKGVEEVQESAGGVADHDYDGASVPIRNRPKDVKRKPGRRPIKKVSPKRKRLNEYIDVNLSGKRYDFDSLDLAPFVAGFLQEIVSTGEFREAEVALQERIKHLSFLVHLACRFDSFDLILSNYESVEADLDHGVADWGDESYWRQWEQRILTQIYFSDHLNEDGEFHLEAATSGDAWKSLQPKTEMADANGNLSDNDSLKDFINDDGSDYEVGASSKGSKPPKKKLKREEMNSNGERELTSTKEKRVRKKRTPAESSFHCVHCGETVAITDGQSKKQHMRACKPFKPLPCDSEGCDFSTIHAKRLEKHKFEVHERTMCSICGMNLDTFAAFTTHMEAHKPEKCPTCGKNFKNTHMLKNHINSTHNKEADEPCHICGKVYKNVANHVRLVHEYAIQNCPHCPYTTRITTDLARHIRRTHTEETVTTCPYCAKTTKNIKRHLQQNRCDKPEEKPVISVKCDRCDKTFSSKEHMKRHVKRVHDKILDVPCPHCDYKTYCNFNLRIHVTRVHEGKALKQPCPYCLQSVISLDWHLKMYHAEKVPGWTGAKTKEEAVDSVVEYTLQQ